MPIYSVLAARWMESIQVALKVIVNIRGIRGW